MSTTIDNKVVEMRFDNKHFESNVADTMSTLDKLKQKLNLSGASKGLENIDNTAKKINFNGMSNAIDTIRVSFSSLEVMGVTALANITNSAVNAGKRIASALTIEPIKTGFSEYETQINAVQTILANTESKGTTLQEVNRALDELNLYADKTIYNFTEMTRNIGTFTAAGIDLKTSVSAIQGIANLAAVSGSTSQQASTAMYQLSQALASGTVKLMDWNSVVNAGMGGQVFQDALKATAKVHGVNVDKIIKKNGSFRESLQEGWITSEILTETLNKFTMAAEEGTEQWNTYKKSLRDQGYSEEEANNILKMANTATEAATKVKTFTQLFDTLKESAQSGWTSTWEIIVGDFGEAKEFLTTISDTVGGMLSASADARNQLLTGGLSTGWKQLLNAGIADEAGYKETLSNVAKEAGFAFDDLIRETEKNGGTFDDALKKALTDGSITTDMLTTSVSKLAEKMKGMSAEERQAAGYTAEHVQQIVALDEGLKNGSISMDEFVKKMMRPSGRENLIESLSNAFTGLMNILKPIKEAWREVFPAMQSEQLYNITVRIKEMTASFAAFTEKYGPQIKSTFKGIFSVIDIGVTFLKEFARGVINLVSEFTGFTGGVLEATAALGDWLSKLRDSVKESDFFGKTIGKAFDYLRSGVTNVLKFLTPGVEGLWNMFKGLWSFVSKIGLSIGKVLGSSLREGDFLSIMNVFNSGVISSILLGINKFVKGFSGSFENIADILDNFKGILEAYQQDIQAKTLMKIATAIGILAASLFVLSIINPENLAAAITAMTFLFGELLGSLAIFGKISGNIKHVFKATAAIIGLSSALLTMSIALKIMSTMDWKGMGVGLISMTVALGELIGVMWALPKDNAGKTTGMIKLAFSLVILGGALKILATMSWVDFGKSMAIMASSLGIFIGLTWALHKTNLSLNTAGMTKLAFSLIVLGGALKILATMSWDDIFRALTVMTIALGEFIGLTWALHATNLSANTAGMTKLAFSLIVLGGALKILGNMSWNEIQRGLVAMTIALGEIIGLTWALHAASATSGKTAGAMLGITSSLILLATALKMLGSMDWDTLIRSGVALAGAFIIIGAAAYFLAPLAPTLLAVAGACALFSVAALGFGVGLGLIAAGVSALALALSTGVTAIVAGLGAIILGIAGLVPELIKIFGESIAILCNVIIECAPLIADTILVVVAKVFESLAKYTPSIVTSLMEFLIGVLQSLRDHLPELIVAAVEVIGAFFDGIVQALKGIDPSSLLQGVAGLTLLTALIYMLSGIAALIPGAMLGVLGLGLVIAELALVLAAIGGIAQIPGVSWIIEEGGNFLQKIGTAIGQFIGGIVGGIALGATSTLPQVGTNLSQFMTNLQPFINGVKNVDMGILGSVAALSGAILLLSGANLISGIATFISFGSSLSDLGTDLSNFMDNASGFIVGASLINPAMMDGVKALAETIMILTAANILEGLTSWFAGGNSLAEFGSQLGDLGTNINLFATNLGTFDESKVVSVNSACEALKALALAANEIPNEGGLWASIVGENSLATFGGYLPGLGTHLSQFVANLGTFTEAQVLTVDCAGRAIKSLATAAQEIPNEGGLWGAIVGDNSLSTFGQYLPGLGTHLCEFVTNLGDFSDSQVSTTDCAGRAIKALALAAQEIPNTGGLWAAIVGDNSLATFGSYLPGLGTNLSGFVTNLGTFDEAQVTTVDCAGKAIKALATAASQIPNEGGFWAKIVGDNSLATFGEKLPGLATHIADFVTNLGTFSDAQVTTVNSACDAIRAIATLGNINIKDTGSGLEAFGTNMVKFATKVKDFVDNIGGVGADSITSAITKTKELVSMAKEVASTNIESIGKFGESLKEFAKKGVKGFVDEFSGNSPKEKAKKAVAEMVQAGVDGADSKLTTVEKKFKSIGEAAVKALQAKSLKSDAKEAGKDLVQGLINGLKDKDKRDQVYNAAFSLGQLAVKGEKDGQQSNSPSKATEKAGKWLGEGLVIGIREMGSKVYGAGKSMGEEATNSISGALNTALNLLNSDMDSQPTIRPILDLSDVESGVGYLSSMFNRGPSLAVATNLGAISSGMNARIQNGQSNDVVSAINKLRKDLGNVKGGDTYNVNGVTYDDGSNITDAVKTLVRAARIERRV